MVKPVVLCILDGWGLSEVTAGNAVALADTPNFDRIMADCPSSTLITYGPDVGLPVGQMGNSEVGHMNIGAGRVVEMDLRRIEGAIERNEVGDLPAMKQLVATMRQSGGRMHLIGVMSDGGVHSHIDHMIACAHVFALNGVPVDIHALTDGRDVAPKSALSYLEVLEAQLPSTARIATVCGRYYALDRDNRWDRVAQAYGAIANGQGLQVPTAKAAIDAAYANDLTDEFIPASVVDDYHGFEDGDGVLCLNFRADRARELMSAIADPKFDAFDVGDRVQLAAVAGFATYSKAHAEFMQTVFPKEDITNTIGAWVAQKGLKQFRIAETEKYPHVTFFLNGGVEQPATGEDRYLAPSPKIATYDLKPEMSSQEVTEHLVGAIKADYDLIVVNYANPDMVGHTGDLEAAMKACVAVDNGLGQVLIALEAQQGAMILTADHGNCEMMIDPETGGPHTAHTTNPVPVALVGGSEGAVLRDGGRLADLAPTLLDLMGLDMPIEMTGRSLLKP